MKPPYRRRTEPSRLMNSIEQEQSENARSFYKGWNRNDLKRCLQALKQQQNFESELDLAEIQKKVPERSLKEIEDLIKTLKSRVLQKVCLQVQSQRREERKAKAPIETWGDLIQKVSRSHEKTISSAFSQSPKTPSRPPNSSVSTTSTASLTQTDSGSNSVDHISKFDNTSVSSPLVPETPTATSSQMTRNPVQLQSEAAPSMSSPVSTGLVSPSVSSDKHSPVTFELLGHDYLCKPRVMKFVVNFDKIYRYLSDIDSQTCNSALTSMECAVLLDVLMCLPEELPLLDCKELQHHLLQLHTKLSKPAVMPASSSSTDSTIPHAVVADTTASTQKISTTTGSTEELSSESPVSKAVKNEDWASAGTCPLNPLLVPVTLLKRKTLDSEK